MDPRGEDSGPKSKRGLVSKTRVQLYFTHLGGGKVAGFFGSLVISDRLVLSTYKLVFWYFPPMQFKIKCVSKSLFQGLHLMAQGVSNRVSSMESVCSVVALHQQRDFLASVDIRDAYICVSMSLKV